MYGSAHAIERPVVTDRERRPRAFGTKPVTDIACKGCIASAVSKVQLAVLKEILVFGDVDVYVMFTVQ